MIITQTPLRVGLVGGGTDLPSYYRQHGGRVLNTAIDKYVYVVVKQRFDDDIYLNYSRKEIVSQVEDVEHDLVREAMHMAGVRGGVEITTLADIPSAGSGLGSSSSVTVGLLQALFTYQGRQLCAEELAERACTIEIDRCGKPIGKQDQYAAAYGGICDLRFGPGDSVQTQQICLPPERHRAFQDQLMLFYTGITRTADTILGEQQANIPDKLAQLQQLKDLAAEAVTGLRSGRPEVVGMALGKSWEAKRQLAQGVSNSRRLGDAGRGDRRQGHRRRRGRLRPRHVPGGAAGVRAHRPGADEGPPDLGGPLRVPGDLQRPPEHLELSR